MWKSIINYMQILRANFLLSSVRSNSWLPIFLGSAAMFVLGACDEELAGDTGREILPQEELVNLVYSDTFAIDMQTQTRDSVPTCNTQLQMFGTYNDPLMGEISTATYLETLTTIDSLWDFSRPQDLAFDSMILQLDLFGWYGNYRTPQQVEVYAIMDEMPPCADITSETSLMLNDSVELSNGYRIDFSNDSMISGRIDIPLDSTLGWKFLTADSEVYSTNANFRSFFPGLYITSSPILNGSDETGAIFRFDGAFDLSTRLILYYRSRPDSLSDFEAREANFFIGVSQFATTVPQKFVQITRSDTEGTKLEESLNGGDELAFIQAGAYLEIKGSFPTLSSLTPETGVNLAELVVRVDTTQFEEPTDSSSVILTPPNALEFVILDANDEPISLTGIPVPQIPYNPSEGTYEFPFTPFLQDILNRDINDFSFLVRPIFQTNTGSFASSLFNQSINRAVIGGVNHPTLFPELRITYTTPQ